VPATRTVDVHVVCHYTVFVIQLTNVVIQYNNVQVWNNTINSHHVLRPAQAVQLYDSPATKESLVSLSEGWSSILFAPISLISSDLGGTSTANVLPIDGSN